MYGNWNLKYITLFLVHMNFACSLWFLWILLFSLKVVCFLEILQKVKVNLKDFFHSFHSTHSDKIFLKMYWLTSFWKIFLSYCMRTEKELFIFICCLSVTTDCIFFIVIRLLHQIRDSWSYRIASVCSLSSLYIFS